MSDIEFLSGPIWQRLGLTLLHFLWQGLAIAVLFGLIIRLFRLSRGNNQYIACLLAFLAMSACPVATFLTLDAPTKLLATPIATQVITEPIVSSWDTLPVLSVEDTQANTSIASPKIVEITEPVKPVSSIPLRERIADYLHTSLPWAISAWLVGVFLLSIRLLMGFVGVRRWRRRLEPLPDNLVQRVTLLADRLGLRSITRVLVSPSAIQAVAIGYFRPMVLLPASMVTQMPPEMLEAVIAHELAHIRRLDLWINLFQRVAETLLFYHPALWWLSNRLRSERELCCDELAIQATGRRLTYASALERAGRLDLTTKQPALAVGLGRDRKPILTRVRHVLGFAPAPQNSRFWLAGLITVTFLAALAVPTALVLTAKAQTELQQDANPKVPDYVAELPGGIKVELVGISINPSGENTWWQPDGSYLDAPCVSLNPKGLNVSKSNIAYELVTRLSGSESLVNRMRAPERWEIEEAKKIGPGRSGTGNDKEGKSLPYLRATSAIISKKVEQIDIKFGIVHDTWKTKLTVKPYEKTTHKIKDYDIRVKPPYENEGNSVVTIKIPNRTDRKAAVRVAAHLKNGSIDENAAQNRDGKISFMDSTDHYEFHALKLADVDHFEIRVGEYQWVKFKNVSLKPDKNWTYNLPGPDSLAFGSKRARVVDSQGKGIAGAVIEFDREAKIKSVKGGPVEKHPLRGGKVVTDSQGRFPMPSLDSVASAHGKTISFYATITADGFIKRVGIPFTMNYDYPQGKGEIDLLRPSTIEGMLIGLEGKPVANTHLFLITEVDYAFPMEGISAQLHTSTDEQGRFKIENVPPGVHLLNYPGTHARSRGFNLPIGNVCGAVQLTVEDGRNIDKVVLDLSKSTCSVTGRILDEKNQPIKGVLANIIVELKIVRDNGSWNAGYIRFYSSEPTDASGIYVLENLPPGNWFINASYPSVKGRTTKSSSNVRVILRPGKEMYKDLILERQRFLEQKSTVPVAGEEPVILGTVSDNDVIFEAIELGDTARVQQYLAGGADINVRKDYYNAPPIELKAITPLILAMAFDNIEIIDLLIANGADVNAKAEGDVTPLLLSIFKKDKRIAELLLAHGADVNTKMKGGITLLHFAYLEGDKEIIDLLIANGADVNAKDENGLTPKESNLDIRGFNSQVQHVLF